MQPFNSLGHLAFRVSDLQASLDFYAKLGFPEFLRLDEEDGQPWIVYLRITDELFIELFPAPTAGRVASPDLIGLNHLCLTTSDIEATAAHLASVGIPLTSPLNPTHRGVDGNRGAWITDPDGNRIEVMEMAPNCIQFEALAKLRATGEATALLRPLRAPATAKA